MNKILFTNYTKSVFFIIFYLFNQSYCKAQANAGLVDNSFSVGSGLDQDIRTIAIQSDGKVLIGGAFSNYNGFACNGIARLNQDGSFDQSFNSGGVGTNNSVYKIIVLPDGKIMMVGFFTSYNGTTINRIARLNQNGTLDNTFTPGTGANIWTSEIIQQADGNFMIGGNFDRINGATINRIARLNPNGTLNLSFNPGTGADSYVYAIAEQADKKLVIGGIFTAYNGTPINRIARLNDNGTLDNTFNVGTGVDLVVYSISIQQDGKIIIAGNFTNYNGTPVNRILRLNTNGSIDNTYNIGTGANTWIYSTLLQSDGKLLVAGYFTSFNGTLRNRIIRLNNDGSIDNSFNPGTGSPSFIYALAIQPDGKILTGGGFSTFNGKNYKRLVRLKGNPLKPTNIIRGSVYFDENGDCIRQSSEKAIPSAMVKATPGNTYGISDDLGNYTIGVEANAIPYVISKAYNSIYEKLLISKCVPSYSLTLTGTNIDTCCFDFADSIRQCSILNISIQSSRMRRCFTNTTFVNYCNYGSIAASSTQIRVEYPSYVVPISSVPAWTSKSGSVLIYDLGTVAGGYCGKITIVDSVVCGIESIRGLTQCIKASISPVSDCVAENSSWDRSSTKVSGKCVNEKVRFSIKNNGTGNMIDSLPYRIYQNDTLIFTGNYKLISLDSLVIYCTADKQTIRIEADQHALHPGKSRPRCTVEACGSSSSGPSITTLVSSAPHDDLNEEEAVSCNIIVDSYDPNDKKSAPEGVGSTNQITPGEELEYTIRFQNTGSDVAYTVKIIDTLDTAFDLASFTKGSSSHPYTLQISGNNPRVLIFTFYNINLPDSTTNKLGSNGLVSFRIKIPASCPLGTSIKNQAYIYFDYNSPITTNQTLHTTGINVEEDFSKGVKIQVGELSTNMRHSIFSFAKIYPNPSDGNITIEIPTYSSGMELRIYSCIGSLKKSFKLNSTSSQQIDLNVLQEGLYVYEIWQEGRRSSIGKLQIQ